MSHLPYRIMHMIQQLHQRGYTDVYLYAGLAPSGMSWRYSIGQIQGGQWPVSPHLVSSGLSKNDHTAWADDNSTVELLTEGFENHFKPQLRKGSYPTVFTNWYAQLLSAIGTDDVLVFFADYGGKHQHWLSSAPGYKGS